jgi:hypothetical protein
MSPYMGGIGRSVLVCSFLFILCACSSLLDMKINGSLTDGVDFGLYRKGSNAIEKVSLNSFYVQEERSGDWIVIWGVEGGGKSVDHIRYGVVPNGFKEMKMADPLTPLGQYRAVANFSRWSGSGLAACAFSIGVDGAVLVKDCQLGGLK